MRAAHYETMRTALILTLGIALREAFTPRARQAWERAFDSLAAAMQRAAAAAG